MPRILFIAILALAACDGSDTTEGAGLATPDIAGWQLTSGKPPTKAEFAALAATCEERANNGPLDSCLADLGLKRAP